MEEEEGVDERKSEGTGAFQGWTKGHWRVLNRENEHVQLCRRIVLRTERAGWEGIRWTRGSCLFPLYLSSERLPIKVMRAAAKLASAGLREHDGPKGEARRQSCQRLEVQWMWRGIRGPR